MKSTLQPCVEIAAKSICQIPLYNLSYTSVISFHNKVMINMFADLAIRILGLVLNMLILSEM